jgi:hypothetical protein
VLGASIPASKPQLIIAAAEVFLPFFIFKIQKLRNGDTAFSEIIWRVGVSPTRYF